MPRYKLGSFSLTYLTIATLCLFLVGCDITIRDSRWHKHVRRLPEQLHDRFRDAGRPGICRAECG